MTLLATHMQAALVHTHGPLDHVEFGTTPIPVPGAGEVLVRVGAASVNFPDILHVAGAYQVKAPTPFVAGSDLAGTVVRLGPDVVDVAVGDRVAGIIAFGAFAEYAVVDVPSLTPLPDAVSFADAAAAGIGYRTAYHALLSTAGTRPGERVCILGAAGGVGLACVDLAVVNGIPAVAVVTGATKAALCRERGALAAIDLGTDDLREGLRAVGGVDVVIDMVGGDIAEPALRSLRPGGRFVTVGFAGGSIPRIPLNLLLLKQLSVVGLEMMGFQKRFPDLIAEGQRDVMGLLASGRLRPHISDRFPLSGARQAMQVVADRAVLGKVVIDVAEPDA